MILTREIKIKIIESNYQYFENIGYDDISIGDELTIPIEVLSKGSHHIISCECDGCGIKKDVIFKNYIKYNNEWRFYYCRKCSEFKRKESLQKNFGCDYPIQNKQIYKKMQKTISKKDKITFEYTITNINNISDYDPLLSKYSNYKSFLRDIKLNTFFNKKSQLTIDEIKPPIICGFKEKVSNSGYFDLKNSVIIIRYISIIIDKNLLTEKTIVKFEILDTPNGDFLKNIINNNLNYKILPNIFDNKIYGFYITLN